MRKRRKKQTSQEREAYRPDFGRRMIEQHGDVGLVARATASDPATVWSWRQPGEGMPDVVQVLAIAQAKKVSAAWLAFGQGARDPQVAGQGFDLAAQMEKYPGLREVILAYCRGTDEDRAGIREAASKVQADR